MHRYGAFREIRPRVFALKYLWDSVRARSVFRAEPHPEWAGRWGWGYRVGLLSAQLMPPWLLVAGWHRGSAEKATVSMM